MPTCSFRDFESVCKKLGLDLIPAKNGTRWKGISPINNEPVNICIHKHAGGRDIADGTLDKYLKDLGFKNFQEFSKYLDTL